MFQGGERVGSKINKVSQSRPTNPDQQNLWRPPCSKIILDSEHDSYIITVARFDVCVFLWLLKKRWVKENKNFRRWWEKDNIKRFLICAIFNSLIFLRQEVQHVNMGSSVEKRWWIFLFHKQNRNVSLKTLVYVGEETRAQWVPHDISTLFSAKLTENIVLNDTK